MRTAFAAVLFFGVVAIASGFFHHHAHDWNHDASEEQVKKDMDVMTTPASATTEGHQEHHHRHHHHEHNESGSGDEGHHHHKHHHKHHHHKHHHHHHKEWKCNGETAKRNEEFIKADKECLKEFHDAKANNVEGREKGIICKSICTGKKMGYFDSEGQIVQSKLDELIESIIPGDDNQSQIKKSTAECAHKFSASLEDGPSDKKCTNYKPYLMCVTTASMKVCKPNTENKN